MSFERITLICGSLCFGIFVCGYAQEGEWLKILRGFALECVLASVCTCMHFAVDVKVFLISMLPLSICID